MREYERQINGPEIERRLLDICCKNMYLHPPVRKATIIERQMSKEPKTISCTFYIVYLYGDFQSSFEDGS